MSRKILPMSTGATAQNLIGSADISYSMSGWTITRIAWARISAAGAVRNPVGVELLARNDSRGSANANSVYQDIPVVTGRKHQGNAPWKDDFLNRTPVTSPLPV